MLFVLCHAPCFFCYFLVKAHWGGGGGLWTLTLVRLNFDLNQLPRDHLYIQTPTAYLGAPICKIPVAWKCFFFLYVSWIWEAPDPRCTTLKLISDLLFLCMPKSVFLMASLKMTGRKEKKKLAWWLLFLLSKICLNFNPNNGTTSKNKQRQVFLVQKAGSAV